MDKPPIITYDFVTSQLKIIMASIIAYSLGKGWLNGSDASILATTLTAAGSLAIPMIWAGYGNWRTKKVPADSVAIRPHVNDTPAVVGMDATGKVVGALLLAVMLNAFMLAPSFAAPLPSLNDPLNGLKNFAVADIQAALDDATANNDTAAVQCWSALLPVVQAQQGIVLKKFGVFLALQKARDAVRTVDAVRLGSGPIGDLKNKCAAIIVDTNTFLIRLGVVGAGSILPF